MLRTIDRILLASAIALLSAGTANAQVFVGSSGRPGDARQMTNANRESNSAFNHVVGTGVKSTIADAPAPAKKAVSVAEARPASAGDITVGATLRDKDGVQIGTVESVDAGGVVVNTGQTKIKVPLVAFGKNGQGLLLGITAARFQDLIGSSQKRVSQ